MLHLIIPQQTNRNNKMQALVFVLFSCTVQLYFSQPTFSLDTYPKNPDINIISYDFYLKLHDVTDSIKGVAVLDIKTKDQPLAQFELDLINVNESLKGHGMHVDSVLISSPNTYSTKFLHKKNRLAIVLEEEIAANTYFSATVFYRGIPHDGLIISNNKFGDRTFFGDNWPNRARHWLPSIDHPYDKAFCTFSVETPIHYEVVASGTKIEESFTNNNSKITRWESQAPLATKLMVIGVAKFAVQHLAEVDHIPVQSWVFPENKVAGFYDYAMAPEILAFFNAKIGPFAYAKLANVQSKTRYGGMENASNIFYYENSVTGQRTIENLIAHEVAHQWFGDAVTEADWHHVWLSEGFATYFTNVYVEHKHGKDSMNRLLNKQKIQIAEYHKKAPTSSIIDLKVNKLTDLLNTNTYQKGAWILHMLRYELGDELFFKGIKKYYQIFKNGNALTKDFQYVMEEVSGKSLDWFFEQWLYSPTLPSVKTAYKYNKRNKTLELTITQTQATKLFTYRLAVLFISDNEERVFKEFNIDKRENRFEISLKNKPDKIVSDPYNNLLLYVE